jgi:capsular polysaccharide biosynthesis protein
MLISVSSFKKPEFRLLINSLSFFFFLEDLKGSIKISKQRTTPLININIRERRKAKASILMMISRIKVIA